MLFTTFVVDVNVESQPDFLEIHRMPETVGWVIVTIFTSRIHHFETPLRDGEEHDENEWLNG